MRNSPNLLQKAPWAAPAIIPLLNAAGTSYVDSNNNPLLTDEQWNLVSRAVMAMALQDISNNAASDAVTLPKFPDYRNINHAEKGAATRRALTYWDPSRVRLFDPLFDPDGPLARAAVKIAKDAGYKQRFHEPKAVLNEFRRNFIDRADERKLLGPWTIHLPKALEEASQRPDSSGAEPKISMSGLAPTRNAVIARRTARTTKSDELDSYASTSAALPADAFRASQGSDLSAEIPVTLSNGRNVSLPMAGLNGRFVRSVVLRLADGTEIDLTQAGRPAPKLGVRWAPSDWTPPAYWKAITLDQLRAALEFQFKTASSAGATLQIELLHPESIPNTPDYVHNAYFEGLAKANPSADAEPSLISALWTSQGGLSQLGQDEALTANKTGSSAILLSNTFGRAQREQFQAGWQTDLGQTIRRQVQALMSVQDEAANIDPILWNAVYKDLKIGQFIRGIDQTTGLPTLWTIDQAIAWQNENPTKPLTDALGVNAEIYTPSPSKLRSIYGDRRSQSEIADMATGKLEPDYSGYTQFNNVLGEDELAVVKGALQVDEAGNWVKRSIIESLAGMLRPMSKYSRSDSKIEAQDDLRSRDFTTRTIHERDLAHEERRTQNYRGDFGKASERNYDRFRSYSTNGSAILSFTTKQGPSADRSATLSTSVEDKLIDDALAQVKAENGRVMWWLAEKSQEQGLGILTGAMLEGSTGTATSPTRDDVVFFSVDSFGGDDARAKLRLDQLMNRGVTIMLVAQREFEHRQILANYLAQQYSYEAAPGTRNLFQPVQEDAQFQNVRASSSTLLEMSGFDFSSRVVIAADFEAPTDENAAQRVAPLFGEEDLSGEIMITTDLLPTQPFWDFAPPTYGPTIDAVKAHIRNLPYKFLEKQAGVKGEEAVAFREAYDRLIERWVDSDERSALPLGHYGPGDLVPLVRSSAAGIDILLYRHGNKAPTRDELEKALEAERPDGERGRVAIYKPEEEKTATVHYGNVRRVVESSYGYKVLMSMTLREFNDKKVLERSGMKYVIGTVTDQLKLPKFKLFENVGIDYYTDTWSGDSKNAWSEDLDNHRLAFAFTGINFEDDLVEFYTGRTPEDTDEYAAAKIRTHQWLSKLSRELPKQDLAVLQQLGRRGFSVETLQLLKSQDANSSWVDKLDAPTTTREKELAGIVQAFMIYLMAPASVRLNEPQYLHILRSGGVNAPGARSGRRQGQLMPPLFTEIFDAMPIGSPTRAYINRKLNEQTQRNGDAGYWINEDFSVTITDEDGNRRVVRLKIPEIHSSGDNPARDMQVNEQGATQPASLSSQNVVSMTLDGRIAVEPSERKYGYINEYDQNIATFKKNSADLYAIPEQNRVIRWHDKTPAEVQYERIAVDVAEEYRQPVDFTLWKKNRSKAEYDLAVENATKQVREIGLALGLKEKQYYIIHHFARQMRGKGLSRDPKNTAGNMSYELFTEALNDIQINLKNGQLPTIGGEVPQIHYTDLVALYQGRARATFRLKLSSTENVYADSWQDWIHAALVFGEVNNTVFDPLFLTAVDGMMASFRVNETSLVGLPVSRSSLVKAKLLDERTQDVLMSLSPLRRAGLSEPEILDRNYASAESMFGVQRVGDRWTGGTPSSSASARTRKARLKWRKENKSSSFPVETGINDVRTQGPQWLHEQTTSNAFARTLLNLRYGTATINPQLWFSAGLESTLWGALNKSATLLTGNGTGRGSQYTPQQQKIIRQTLETLGSNPRFKQLVYGDMLFKQDRGGTGFIERLSQRYARIGQFLQDPGHGLKGHTMARTYMEAVLEWVSANPIDIVVSTESLMDKIATDPTWVSRFMPAAHKMAMARISSMRGLKQTPLSMAIDGIVDPLTQNPHFGLSTTSTILLKLPLMFQTYAIGTGTKLLGLQAANDMLTMFLNGRENKLAGFQRWLAGDVQRSTDPVHFDMDSALEGIDLARSFAQSGVSHAALFALGSLVGSLGLGGEDEEERRRRRAQMYQTGQIVYDPRDIINDFRNADAVFLDWLPFGLSALFQVPDPEGTNTAHSMAQMPWFLRQFVSPVLGMSKALETGDFRYITWGYQDALASFPLINASTWDSTNDLVGRLLQQAEAAGDVDASLDLQLDAWGNLINGVAAYEKMLFENSFINMIYVGMDKYDRNPWVLPRTDIDGNIIRPDLNQPAETTALDQYVDPETGEVKLSNKQRDFWDATIHSFSENCATLALAMSLFTGQGLEGSTLRQNMVVKTRTVDKEVLSEDAARALVSGLYAGSGAEDLVMSQVLGGQEVLTSPGAQAIIRGAWKGSLDLESPAMQGVFIPFEMREQLQAYFMDSLIQEGLDAGLNEYNAKQYMYSVWKGSQTNPDGIGLQEILWSDKIPYAASDTYRQLNTTYIMGPDSRPWATGVSRNTLQTMFGLAPATYMTGEVGNLGVDGSLNSTDEARNLNTGLRGLEKVNASDWVPTAEEIGKSIEDAITKAMNTPRTTDGSTNGYSYRSGGGGGGGGGGSYAYRVNSPERNDAIYARQLYNLNVDNPIIRRATIRRERFSSERGRLKPWQ